MRRFVFASSCSMYGASGTDDALDEDAPLRPLTPYAESKVRAEEGLFALAGPDFVPVSMRNATVFGVSPRLRLDIVLNNLAAWAHTTGRIRLLSDGTAWRPLVHVRDVAKSALALLEAPEEQIRGEAFNVGTDEQNYLVRELAEVLAQVTGCEIEIAEGSSADSALLPRRLLEARPHVPGPRRSSGTPNAGRASSSMPTGEVGLTSEDFDGNRYVRLRRLLTLLEAGELDVDLRWRSPVAA